LVTISIRPELAQLDRVIQFADKFLDEILDKTQLQRFLGSLNYVAEFYQVLGNNVSLFLIDFKAILLLGHQFTPQLSRILKNTSRPCPVLASQQ
jgi:hypothetical protein